MTITEAEIAEGERLLAIFDAAMKSRDEVEISLANHVLQEWAGDNFPALLASARREAALREALEYVMTAHGEQLTDAFENAEKVLGRAALSEEKP